MCIPSTKCCSKQFDSQRTEMCGYVIGRLYASRYSYTFQNSHCLHLLHLLFRCNVFPLFRFFLESVGAQIRRMGLTFARLTSTSQLVFIALSAVHTGLSSLKKIPIRGRERESGLEPPQPEQTSPSGTSVGTPPTLPGPR